MFNWYWFHVILVSLFFRRSYQNTKNRLHDFHYHVFCFFILQGKTGKTGKTKMKKNNNNNKNYYVIFLFFVTSSTKTKNEKWNEPNKYWIKKYVDDVTIFYDRSQKLRKNCIRHSSCFHKKNVSPISLSMYTKTLFA